jgi:hypothetical protein
MANPNTPFGLRATVNPYGGQPVVNAYYIPSSYGTALFVGDPVIKTGTANANTIIADREYAPGSLPEINKATAGSGNLITGVILGFAFLPTDLAKTYNPASTERVALVCDDPAQLFEIQAETAGTALAITEIGLNANLVYAESGSTLTGLSGAELDTSTPATTQAFQLKIKRIIDRGDNELGTHAKVLVSINQHTEADNTAGI